MSLNTDCVIGIDGGGTYTRTVVADLEGNVLGFSKKGGIHPGKNKNPERNLRNSINEALKMANRSKDSIVSVVGGFAGFNTVEDEKWAKKLFNQCEIDAPVTIVNDAEIAQFGVFLGESGIIAVAGTGSIVFGKTENGTKINNYHFHHDSKAAARYLTYEVIYEIISQSIHTLDTNLVNAVLHYWKVKDIKELRLLASNGFSNHHMEAIRKLGNMAHIITNEAESGSPIALRACEKVVESLVMGIQLVSSTFSEDTVPLSFIGGVANQPLIKKMLLKQLDSERQIKKFKFTSKLLPPVFGAVLFSYHHLGITQLENKKEKLGNLEDMTKFL